MIKIHSNQNINGENVFPVPSEVYTNDQQWWMIYDANDKKISVNPQQCSGYTSSPLTMVVADSEEELNQYILENNLQEPTPYPFL
jgi:hypothetical protein